MRSAAWAVWLMCLTVGSQCQTLEAVYTSTRSVTSIAVTSKGTVVAGTRGGMLLRTGGGAWRKYTVLDGLPDNEVLDVYELDGNTIACTGRGCSRLEGDRWIADPSAKPRARLVEGQICRARWKNVDCVSTTAGLSIRMGKSWKLIGLPRSSGTHISALLDRPDTLWAAMYGDGVFAWNGKQWNAVKLGLPKSARDITAMAADGRRLWLGTRGDGIWEYDGHRWTQHLEPDEPADHNCQALAWYGGSLYISTLEDGLVVRSPDGWRHLGAREMSANTPRDMVEFQGCLYVRQSIGTVDRFDGRAWKKKALPDLPRKQASVLAADGDRLYVGQWGGWSEFDGRAWTHRLDIAELQGCQITALLPAGGTLWVGTQRLGTAQVDRAMGTMKWHNELSGMPDDTIKCLAARADTVYAGTFSQGLAWASGQGGRWTRATEATVAQVTGLEPDAAGGIYVGARTGLWRLGADTQMRPLMRGVEVQALRLVGDDLWVGTRTGLLRFAVGRN